MMFNKIYKKLKQAANEHKKAGLTTKPDLYYAYVSKDAVLFTDSEILKLNDPKYKTFFVGLFG